MRIYSIITGSVFKAFALIFFISAFPSCRSRKPVVENASWSVIENKLGIKLDQYQDVNYYREVSNWLGVPYKFGGNTRSGTDCSGLVTVVYEVIFGKKLPRQSAQQKEQSKPVENRKLQPGDLYFFNTSGKGVSHVGMHLSEGYFIHSSVQKGVIVSNLREAYYAKNFVGYGTFR